MTSPPTALVVGSGPAAAGATLALVERGVSVTVLDIGLRLEPERAAAAEALARRPHALWTDDDLALVSRQPEATKVRGLPEKRAYGSDFPFRDAGQLAGIVGLGGANRAVVSGAYGGFSNVWGAQFMPFSKATFDTWPVSLAEIEPHYRAILEHVPFAGEDDDLAERFPLIGDGTPLPAVSSRTRWVLQRYRERRAALQRHGVTLGRARLAFQADACVRCGLCMTGCPTNLVYSASQTFDDLVRRGAITYRGNLLATEVTEDEHASSVVARDLGTGRLERFSADRVYVACGAFGTTRLAASSLQLFDQPLSIQESAQFTLPFVSLRPTVDPRDEGAFTLNQFNMVVELDGTGLDVSQLHFYSYNPAFEDAMPRPLHSAAGRPVRERLLRHLSVALGYLPSWASPDLSAEVRAPSSPGEMAGLHITRDEPDWKRNAFLRRVLQRVGAAGRHLDLWPALPMLGLSAGAKSYHWGSSFPMTGRATLRSADSLGRIGPWRRTHLVDASVFPNVPATTFTLTIMANAHRIAAESIEIPA